MVERDGMIYPFLLPSGARFFDSPIAPARRKWTTDHAGIGIQLKDAHDFLQKPPRPKTRKKHSAPSSSSSSSRHRLFRGRSRASASSASSSPAPWGATFALVNCILGAGKGFGWIGNEGDGRERETVFSFFSNEKSIFFPLFFFWWTLFSRENKGKKLAARGRFSTALSLQPLDARGLLRRRYEEERERNNEREEEREAFSLRDLDPRPLSSLTSFSFCLSLKLSPTPPPSPSNRRPRLPVRLQVVRARPWGPAPLRRGAGDPVQRAAAAAARGEGGEQEAFDDADEQEWRR